MLSPQYAFPDTSIICNMDTCGHLNLYNACHFVSIYGFYIDLTKHSTATGAFVLSLLLFIVLQWAFCRSSSIWMQVSSFLSLYFLYVA